MNFFYLLFLFLSMQLITPASADENLFGYVTSADPLPRDAWEVYQWVTRREGKATGTYVAHDYRTEVEYGLLDRLTLSLYVNLRQHTISNSTSLDEETGAPAYPNLESGVRFQGLQSSVKYNFLSAYKDDIGLSVYLEPGFSRVFKITGELQKEYSLEVKLIAQRNFLEDQLVTTLNISPEFEVRKFEADTEWQHELAIESTAGASYRFIPNWFGGVEARYHSEYPDYGPREHYAVFMGPNVHYGAEQWWFTVTWLPQAFGGPHTGGHTGRLHLNEHEKNEYRLKVGYNL